MKPNPTPLLLHGGRIFPRADQERTVEALLLLHGRVLAAGGRAEIDESWPIRPQTLDLQGRSVLPGLCDAHIHLEQYARSLDWVDCATAERADCTARVRERASRSPAGTWIRGHGWNQNDWGGHGSAAELDRAAPDHPVYLTARSLHAAWVNSAALRLAGIDRHTADPPGGAIVRGPDGSASGILLEEAMRLVADLIPEPGMAEIAAQVDAAQRALWALGITAIHDFDGPRCLRALQQLRSDGRLGLHVLKSLPAALLPQAEAIGLQTGFGDDWLRIGHLKLFADGALGPRTAWMLEPYTGEPENLGIGLIDREGILETGIAAARAGLPLAIHAIGDRANHEVLEGLAALREHERLQGLPPLPHRIEHLQLLHPDDLPRAAALGVIASMQPIHATSDMAMADRYWAHRTRTAYAWNSQLRHGARLAFGSDAPVESPNPWRGLHAAVTRRRDDGSPGPQGWVPEERIGLHEALRAFTIGPAEAARLHERLGRLEPGYWGDLIVLEEAPYGQDPDRLRSVAPVATMVAGAWVYPGDGPSF